MAGSWIGAIVGAGAGVAITSMVDGTSTTHHAVGAMIGAAALYYLLGLLGVP
jgi:hypothetical protein